MYARCASPTSTRRSSRPTMPSPSANLSCWFTTTTPDTCARSSTPNTPAATAGNIGPNLDVLTHNADVQGSLAADPDGQTGKESGWLLIGVACAGAFVTLAVVGL